jgi:hypothetical protein
LIERSGPFDRRLRPEGRYRLIKGALDPLQGSLGRLGPGGKHFLDMRFRFDQNDLAGISSPEGVPLRPWARDNALKGVSGRP